MPERDNKFCRAAKSFRAARQDTRSQESHICVLRDRREKSTNPRARTARPADLPGEIVPQCRSAAKRLNILCRSRCAAAQLLDSRCEFPKADWVETLKAQ